MTDAGFVARSLLLDTLEVESFTTGPVMESCDTSKSLACTNPENTCCTTRHPPCPDTYACPADPP